jgi:3-deoxy-manno-octulosonate cytidylyltransferase (CMP-KDO synthetase)
MDNSTIVIIPARLNSTRLPNKVLLDICGKSMIQRVYESSKKSKNIDDVYIATDSKEVEIHCLRFTKNVIMTSDSCKSGTDRLAEASIDLKCSNIINVQGDEPLISPDLIDELALSIGSSKVDMVSAMHKIDNIDDLNNSNVVKVVVDKYDDAIYFSRHPIPYIRDEKSDINCSKILDEVDFYKHIGIYGYKKKFLSLYTKLKQTPLEEQEKLEQLRAIENGYKIKMITTNYNSLGVDTIDDLKQVSTIIEQNNLQ